MRHTATVALIACCMTTAAMAGCSGQSNQPSQPSQPAHGPSTSRSAACGAEPHPHRYLGIIDEAPGSPAYSRFIARTHARPTLVDFFVNFGKRWDPASACWAVRHGALPLLQFNLRRYSAAKIAGGAVNGYVAHLAGQVRTFGLPIVISLGHEMNGNWYPWGWKHTPARTFVAMWRHVHNIFTAHKASNVIWMWTINRAAPPATGPKPWWPGQAYVNWVGVDGHLRHPADTFGKVFASTIADVRTLTRDPILISEVAVVAGRHRPAQLASLFRAVYRQPGIVGLVYLNMWTVRIDWRLKDAASIRAFTKAIKPYGATANG